MDEKEQKLIQLVEELFPYHSSIEVSAEMKQGLARAYSDKGFRIFMEESINKATRDSAYAIGDEHLRYRTRMVTLTKLYLDAKKMFIEYDKIKNKSEGKE